MTKTILIPSTFTAETKNPLIRNYKIGELARVCTTFGIEQIIVYYDHDRLFDSHGLGRRIVRSLLYCNTPPHLRRKVFDKKEKDDEALRYVGIMPPLKAPHHTGKSGYLAGYVERVDRGFARVYLGEKELPVRIEAPGLREGQIVFVDVEGRKIVNKEEIDEYMGYEVDYYNKPLHVLLQALKDDGYYVIGTSKKGKDLGETELKKEQKNIAIVFGSAFRGLYDMLNGEDLKNVDEMISVIQDQKSETIRTEEAVYYTFSLLRYLDVI